MRWILIDRFEEIRKGQYARGLKGVSRAEEALLDVYPCYPTTPASLLLEMMAQVGGVLTGATIDFAKEVVLAKITDAEFYESVTPPSILVIEARLIEQGEDAAMTECTITRDGKPAAKANIFFGLFKSLGEGGKKSMVFSKDFMESFAIREVMTDA